MKQEKALTKQENVLFVLGASSDIGVEFINKYSDNYDTILAHYFHVNEKLLELKEKLNDKLILLNADFSKLEDIEKMINNIHKINKIPTCILHLTAPKFYYSKCHKTPFIDYEKEFKITYFSFLRIIQEFIPSMLKKKCGNIVVMLTSCTKGTPPKYLSHYVSAKYALLGLIKSLGADYAEKGIRINGISPEMLETKFLSEIPEFIIENHALSQPLKQNLSVSDILETIEFLLSDKSKCISGQNIFITNGT